MAYAGGCIDPVTSYSLDENSDGQGTMRIARDSVYVQDQIGDMSSRRGE